MKKFTSLIILLFLIVYGLMPAKAIAQTQQVEPQDCFYIPDNECYAVGYVSVTPRPPQEGGPQNDQLDVEIFFQDICDTISQIVITQVQGDPFRILDDEITSILDTRSFPVNANSFKDGNLRIEIYFGGNNRVIVPIHYDESLDCGEITPLPVELTRFEGKATESGIALEWATASELNNSHFDVERSSDGKRFESIARQQGHGTTSTPATYTYNDKLPQNGINYYRLKQVDYDNTFSFTKTLAVRWQAGDAMQIAMVPNPCLNGDCKIALSNAAKRETLIQLKDMAGRVIYSKTVTSDSHLFELPLNELGKYKGLYFLSATTGQQVMHQRILLE